MSDAQAASASPSANVPPPPAAAASPFEPTLPAPAPVTDDASKDIMDSLGAPIGDSGTAVEGDKDGADVVGAATSVPSSASPPPATPAQIDQPSPFAVDPSTSAPPTTTNSTATGTTAAVSSESKSDRPAPPAAAAVIEPAPTSRAQTDGVPATAPSSSSPPVRQPSPKPASGTHQQRTSTKTKEKKKKSALQSLLASVFFCFPSDDNGYDGKKPSTTSNGTASTSATAKAPVKKEAGVTEKAVGGEGATKSAGQSSELRQITSRELMDVATPEGKPTKDAEKTPKPSHIALPANPPPTTPLNTKRSTSNIAEGGDVLIPPPTPTSPPIDETAGLTSSAVVPPGSGTALLHAHQHHSHHSGQPTPSHSTTPTPSPKLPPTDPVAAGDESFSATDSEVSGSDAGGGQRYDDSQADDGAHQHGTDLDDEEEEEEDEDAHLLGGVGIPIGPDGRECPLLPPLSEAHKGKKCLVLDLDETLLHSSFKLIPQADYIVPVEIESQTHNVYVIKRPGVDNFLQRMGEIYEVVVFTASLSKYADPVLDMLDVHRVVSHRLFRESCYNHKGNYVKDLSQLGRPIDETIIIDNSPASYIFHPNNAVPVSTWFNDPHDSELSDLIMFLADLANVEDVRGVLDGGL